MVGSAIDIALSGLLANSRRIENAASNIANATSSGAIDPADGPTAFAPNDVVQQTQPNGGVGTITVPRDPAFVPSFDPGSPFANSEGLINTPNVNLAEEAVDVSISRIAFQANLAVIETVNDLSEEVLSIFDEEA